MSEEIERAIRALGNEFNHAVLEATRAIYARSVRLQERKRPVREDVRYGPHARHVLDIYGEDDDVGVVLFIHGGGFTGGTKRGDELFYGNIGHAFASAGFQTVLANYRLAPEATWPSGIEDVQRAVHWIQENLVGASRSRPLVVIGQSAGAAHVAGYVFGHGTTVDAAARLAGSILMSGVYDLQRFRSPGAQAYFGADASVARDRSPIAQVLKTPVPLLVTVSELDPPAIAGHGFELAQRVTEATGKTPAFAWFRGHNHVSTVHSLGSTQGDVGKVLLDFLQPCLGR